MPLYEYKCPQCGEIIEILRAIQYRDDPINCCKCRTVCRHILSKFNSHKKNRPRSTETCTEASESGRVAQNTGGTAIRLGGVNATVKDCSFTNLRAGISLAKGTKVNMCDNKFDNVTTPIEVTDE